MYSELDVDKAEAKISRTVVAFWKVAIRGYNLKPPRICFTCSHLMFVPSRAAIRALRQACSSPAPALRCGREACRTASTATINKAFANEAPNGLQKRRRKSKGKTETIKVEPILPQGLLDPAEAQPDVPEDVGPDYPTVIQQARNNMRKFEHCVLLTRVGNFYELYFEHAEEYGPLLGLKVGSKKTSAGAVAMAGFPFFQLDRFLKMLVQDHGRHVAISEETANDPSQKVKSGGLLFDRQVKRVITPGTLIDENFLSPFEHNYLLAVAPESTSSGESSKLDVSDRVLTSSVGLSWIDLSSGDFYTQTTTLDSLPSAIARISPREIIVEEVKGTTAAQRALALILQAQGQSPSLVKPPLSMLSDEDWQQLLDDPTAISILMTFRGEELVASNLLLQYAKDQLPGLKLKLQAPIRQSTDDYMIIDKNSLRGLEVTQTLRDGLFKGSLLHAVRRTCTESGTRLLAQRLSKHGVAR